jgi:hypothetical protein
LSYEHNSKWLNYLHKSNFPKKWKTLLKRAIQKCSSLYGEKIHDFHIYKRFSRMSSDIWNIWNHEKDQNVYLSEYSTQNKKRTKFFRFFFPVKILFEISYVKIVHLFACSSDIQLFSFFKVQVMNIILPLLILSSSSPHQVMIGSFVYSIILFEKYRHYSHDNLMRGFCKIKSGTLMFVT